MSVLFLMSSNIPNDYTLMHQECLLNNISSTDHNQLEKQSIDKQESSIYVFDILEAIIIPNKHNHMLEAIVILNKHNEMFYVFVWFTFYK